MPSGRTPSAPKLAPHVASRPHHVEALGGDLVDAVTGKRLWSRGLDQQRPMGSITKVMTALLVIRAGHLRRHIKITKAIPAYIRRHPGTSSAGLRAGDVLTVRQLLDAMLLPSGCDAALALARAYGPGRAAFVQKMNATALKLGLRRTHFSNFDGLPLPTEHSTYSTPRNLITLGRAAMKLRAFRRIVRPAVPPPQQERRAPRLLLAEYQPAARFLSRRRRDQDGTYERGRVLPAVRGQLRRPHPDRRCPAQFRHQPHHALHRRHQAPGLGIRHLSGTAAPAGRSRSATSASRRHPRAPAAAGDRSQLRRVARHLLDPRLRICRSVGA